MIRAERRREARVEMKKIMRDELHPDKVDLDRASRRNIAWQEAKNRVNEEVYLDSLETWLKESRE